MRNLIVLLFLVLIAPGLSLAGPNLRVMPPSELASKSDVIARVRVIETEESDWGDFRQVAKLELVDVIDGDFTIKHVNVAARSLHAFTDDKYEKKEEFLVFLSHDAGFYRTINFQYGQFRIENDIVRGWRDEDNNPSDKPYYAVREDIERILTELRSPTTTDAPSSESDMPQPPVDQPQSRQTDASQRKPNPKPVRVVRTRPPQS